MLQASPTPRDALIRLEPKSFLSAQQQALWDTFLHRHVPVAGPSAEGGKAVARRHPKTTPSAAAHTRAAAYSTTGRATSSTRIQTRNSTTGGSAAAAPPQSRAAASRRQQQSKEFSRHCQQRDSGHDTAADRRYLQRTRRGATAAATQVRITHSAAVPGRGVQISARATPTSRISHAAGLDPKGSAAGAAAAAAPPPSHINSRYVSPAPAVAPLRTPRPVPAAPPPAAAAAPAPAPATISVEVRKNAAPTPLDTATAAAAAAAFAVATTTEDISSPRLFATHLSTWWRQQHELQGCTPQRQRLQRIQSPREQSIRHSSRFEGYNRYDRSSGHTSSNKYNESKDLAHQLATSTAVNTHRRRISTDSLFPSDAHTAAQWTSGTAAEPAQGAAGRAAAATKARTAAPTGATVAAPRLQQPETRRSMNPVGAESVSPSYATSAGTTTTSTALLQRQQRQRHGQSETHREQLQGSQGQQLQSAQAYWKPHEQSRLPQPQVLSQQQQPHGQRQQHEGGQEEQHLPSRRQQRQWEQSQHTVLPHLHEPHQQWHQQQHRHQWEDQQRPQLTAPLKETAAPPASKTVDGGVPGQATAPPTLAAAAVTTAAGGNSSAVAVSVADKGRQTATREADGRAPRDRVTVRAVETGPNADVAAVSAPCWGGIAAQQRSNIPRVDLTVESSLKEQQQQRPLPRQQRPQQQHQKQSQPSTQQQPVQQHGSDRLRPTTGPSKKQALLHQHQVLLQQQKLIPFERQSGQLSLTANVEQHEQTERQKRLQQFQGMQQQAQRQQQQFGKLPPLSGFTCSSTSPRQRAVPPAVASPAGPAANELRWTEQQQLLGHQQFAGVLRRELAQAFSKVSQQTVRGMRGELQGLRKDFDTLVEHVKHQQRACTPSLPTAAAAGSFPPPLCLSTSFSATQSAAPFAAGAAGSTSSGAVVAPFGCMPGAAGPFAAPAAAVDFRAAAAFPFAVPAAAAPFGGPAPSFTLPPAAASFSSATAATPHPAAGAPFPAVSAVPFPGSGGFPPGFAYPPAVAGHSAATATAHTASPDASKGPRSSSEPRRRRRSWRRQQLDAEFGGDERSISSDTAWEMSSASSPAAAALAKERPHKMKQKEQKLTLREHREDQQLHRAEVELQRITQQRRVAAEQPYPLGQPQRHTHLHARPPHQQQVFFEEQQRQQKYTGFKTSVVALDLPERPLRETGRQRMRMQGGLNTNETSVQNRSSSSCIVAAKESAVLSPASAECNARTIITSLNELSQNLESLARTSAAVAAGRSSSHSADLAAFIDDAAVAAVRAGSGRGGASAAAPGDTVLASKARSTREAPRAVAAAEKKVTASHVSLSITHPLQQQWQQQQLRQRHGEGRSPRTTCSSLVNLMQQHSLQQQQWREMQEEEKQQQQQQHHLSDRPGNATTRATAGTVTIQQQKNAATPAASCPATTNQEDIHGSVLHHVQKWSLLDEATFPLAAASPLPTSSPASIAAATSATYSAQLPGAAANRSRRRQQQHRELHAVEEEPFRALKQQVLLYGVPPPPEATSLRYISLTAPEPSLRVCAATTERPTYLQRMASGLCRPATPLSCADVPPTHVAASSSSAAAEKPPVDVVFPAAAAAGRSPLAPAATFLSHDYAAVAVAGASPSRPAAEAAASSPCAAAATFSPSALDVVPAAFCAAAVGRDTAASVRRCSGEAKINRAPSAAVSYKAGEATLISQGNGNGCGTAAGGSSSLPDCSVFYAGEEKQRRSDGLIAGAKTGPAAVQAAAAAREAAAAAKTAAASAKGAAAAQAAAAAARAAAAAKEAAAADAIAAAKATAAAEAAAVAKAAAACATSRARGCLETATAEASGMGHQSYISSSFSFAAVTAVRRSLSSSSLLCGRSSSSSSRASTSLYRSASYRTCAEPDLTSYCGRSKAKTSCNHHSGLSSSRNMRKLLDESRQQLQHQGPHPEGSRRLRRTSWPTTAGRNSVAPLAQAPGEEIATRRVAPARICTAGNTNTIHLSRSNSSSYAAGSSYGFRSTNTQLRRCRRCEACGVPPATLESSAAAVPCSSYSHSSSGQGKSRSCGNSSSISSSSEVGKSHMQNQASEGGTAELKQHRSGVHQRKHTRSRTSTTPNVAEEELLPEGHTASAEAGTDVANKQIDANVKAEGAVDTAIQSTGRVVVTGTAATRSSKEAVASPPFKKPCSTAPEAGTAPARKAASGASSIAYNLSEPKTRQGRDEARLSHPLAPAAEAPAEARATAATALAAPSTVRSTVLGAAAQKAVSATPTPAVAAPTPATARVAVSGCTVTKTAAAQNTPRTPAVSTAPRPAAAARPNSRSTPTAGISNDDELAAACRVVASAAAAALCKERRPSSGHTSRSPTSLSSLSDSVCSCNCCCCGRHTSHKGRGRCCCSTANSRSYSETSSTEENSSLSPASPVSLSFCCSPAAVSSPAGATEAAAVRRRDRPFNSTRCAAAAAAKNREQQQQLREQLQQQLQQTLQREQQQQHAELLFLLRDVGASSFSWQMLVQQQVLLQQQLMHQLQQPIKQQSRCSESCRRMAHAGSSSAASGRRGRHKPASSHAPAVKKAEGQTAATGEGAVGATATTMLHTNEAPARQTSGAAEAAGPLQALSAATATPSAAPCSATGAGERVSASEAPGLSNIMETTTSEERPPAAGALQAAATPGGGQMVEAVAEMQSGAGPVFVVMTTTHSSPEAPVTPHVEDKAAAATAAQGRLLQQQNSDIHQRGQQSTATPREVTAGTNPKNGTQVSTPCSNVVATSEAAFSSPAKVAGLHSSTVCKCTHSNSSIPSTSCSTSAAGLQRSCTAVAAAIREEGAGNPGPAAAERSPIDTANYSILTAGLSGATCSITSATTITAAPATAPGNVVVATLGGNARSPTPADAGAAVERAIAAGEQKLATGAAKLYAANQSLPAAIAVSNESRAAGFAALGPASTIKKSVDRGSSPVDSYPPCRKTRAVSPITFSASLHDMCNSDTNAVRQLQLSKSIATAAAARNSSPVSVVSCISSSDLDVEAKYDVKKSGSAVESYPASHSATERQHAELVKQQEKLLQRQHHLQLRQRPKARLNQKHHDFETESQSQLEIAQHQQSVALADVLQRRLQLLQHQSTASSEGCAEQRLLSCAAELLQRTDDLLSMKQQRSSRHSSSGQSRTLKEADRKSEESGPEDTPPVSSLQQPQEQSQKRQQSKEDQPHLRQQQHTQRDLREEQEDGKQPEDTQLQRSPSHELEMKHAQLLSLKRMSAAVQTSSPIAPTCKTHESLSSSRLLRPSAAAEGGTANSNRSSSPRCGIADPALPLPVASHRASPAAGFAPAAASPVALLDCASALSSETEFADRSVGPTHSGFCSGSRKTRSNRTSCRSFRSVSGGSKQSSSCDTPRRSASGKSTRGDTVSSTGRNNGRDISYCRDIGRSRRQKSPSSRSEASQQRKRRTQDNSSDLIVKDRNSKSGNSKESKPSHASPMNKNRALAQVGNSSAAGCTVSGKRRCSVGHNSSTSTITVLNTRDAGHPLRLPSLPALLLEGLESYRSITDQARSSSELDRRSSRDSTQCKSSSSNKLEERGSQCETEGNTCGRGLRGRHSTRGRSSRSSTGTVRRKTENSSKGAKEGSRVPSVDTSPGRKATAFTRINHIVSDSNRNLRTGHGRCNKKTERNCSRKPGRSFRRRTRRNNSRQRQRIRIREAHTEDSSYSSSRGSVESSGSRSRSTHQSDTGSSGLDSSNSSRTRTQRHCTSSDLSPSFANRHKCCNRRSSRTGHRRQLGKSIGSGRRSTKGNRSNKSGSERGSHRSVRPVTQRLAGGERIRTQQQRTFRRNDWVADFHPLPEQPQEASTSFRLAPKLQQQDAVHEQEQFDGWTEGSSEGEVILRQKLRRRAPPSAAEYGRQEKKRCTLPRPSQERDVPLLQQQEPHQGTQERGRSGFGLRRIASTAQQLLTGEAHMSGSVLLLLSGGRLQPLLCGRYPGTAVGAMGVERATSEVRDLTSADRRSSATRLAATTGGDLHAPATDAVAAAAIDVAGSACGTEAATGTLAAVTAASATPLVDGSEGSQRNDDLCGAADAAKRGGTSRSAASAAAAAAVAADVPLSHLEATSARAVYSKRLLPSPQFSDLSLSSGEVPPGCTPLLPPRPVKPWASTLATLPPCVAATVAAESILPVSTSVTGADFVSLSSLGDAGTAAPRAAATHHDAATAAAVPVASASSGMGGKSKAEPFRPSPTPSPAFWASSDTLFLPAADTSPRAGGLASLAEVSADVASPASAECGNLFTFACQIPSPPPCSPSNRRSGSPSRDAATSGQQHQLESAVGNASQKPAHHQRPRATTAAYAATGEAEKSDHFLAAAAAAPQTLKHSTATADASFFEGGFSVARKQERTYYGRDGEQVYHLPSEGKAECGALAAARESLGVAQKVPSPAAGAPIAEETTSVQKSASCGGDNRKAALKPLTVAAEGYYLWSEEIDESTSLAGEQASAAESILKKHTENLGENQQADADIHLQRQKQVQQQQKLKFHLKQQQSRLQVPQQEQDCLQNPLKHHERARSYGEEAGRSGHSTKCVVQSERQSHCLTTSGTRQAAAPSQHGAAQQRGVAVEETLVGPVKDKHNLLTHNDFDLSCNDRRSTSSQRSRDDPCWDACSSDDRGPRGNTKEHNGTNSVTCTGDSNNTDDATVDNPWDVGICERFLSSGKHSSGSLCIAPVAAEEKRSPPYEVSTHQQPAASQELRNCTTVNETMSTEGDAGEQSSRKDAASEYNSPQAYHVAQLVRQQQQYIRQQQHLPLLLQEQPFYENHLQQHQVQQATLHRDHLTQLQQQHIYPQQESGECKQHQQQVWPQTWQQCPIERKTEIKRFIRFPRHFRPSSSNRMRSQLRGDSALREQLPSASGRNSELQGTEASRLQRLCSWRMRRESSVISEESAQGRDAAVKVTRRGSCPPPVGFQSRTRSFNFPALHFFPFRKAAAAERAAAGKADGAWVESKRLSSLQPYCRAPLSAVAAGQIDAGSSVVAAERNNHFFRSTDAPASDCPAFATTGADVAVYGCGKTPVVHDAFADASSADASSARKSPSGKTSPPPTTAGNDTEEPSAASATDTATATATAIPAGDSALAASESNTEGEWCMQADVQDAPTMVDAVEPRLSEEPEDSVVKCTTEKWNPPVFSHSSTTSCPPSLPVYSAGSSSASSAKPSAAACASSSSASCPSTSPASCHNYSFSVLPTKSPHVWVANAARCTNSRSEILFRVSAHAQRLMQRAKQLRGRRMSS